MPGNKGKVAVIILIFLIVLSCSLAVGGFFLLQNEQKKNLKLQGELSALAEEQKLTQARLEQSLKTVNDLEVKLREAEIKISALAGDLEKEKASKQETLAQIAQIKSDLEKQKSLRSDLEAKLLQSQSDSKAMQDKLSVLEEQKKQLEDKVNELEARTEQVELGTIIVSPEVQEKPAEKKKAPKKERPLSAQPKVEPAAAPVNEGKVLVVNKEYSFAVINLGGKDGVKVGDNFLVYHDNKVVGSLKVEKVHESMAAATFSSSAMRDKVSEGDRVARKG